ncbi:MAG: 5-oxoprolinase subunit PxpB [Verrucomicrobiota bacterium]|nr:5-oxoprolinase subunit PxpB [Verrucomicrobiota bacterium]
MSSSSANIAPLGDSALLLDFAGDPTPLARAHATADAIQRATISGVIDIVPAFQSVAVFFDLNRIEPEELATQLRELSASAKIQSSKSARVVEIPVAFDEQLDLERVAKHVSLRRDEIIAQFCATEFTVACLGFLPGFAYLDGLPPQLRVPRLEMPRTKVPAGSVAIAGAQASIYPFDSPGGWNVIGRTAFPLFYPRHDPPAFLGPGDRVRFRAVAP